MPEEPNSSTPTVSGVAMTGLDLALSRLQCDPDEVFRSCGIEPDSIGKHDRTISLSCYLRFYETIQRDYNLSAFGAQFGAITRPKNAGLLGYLALNAPDLEHAINDFIRFLPLLLQGFHVDLIKLPAEQWQLSFSLMNKQSIAAPQVNEQGLAWVSNIIRAALRQRRWQPDQLHLEHGRPSHRALLERIFGPNIHYGQPANALIIKDSDLRRQNDHADSLLYRTLRYQAELNLAQSSHHAPWLEFVEFTLQQLILANTPTLAALASKLELQPRKLQARLKHRGTNFSQLLSQLRFRLGSRLLSQRQGSISEIALSLGYSEAAAFTHAFKHQAGETPREYRARTQEPDNHDLYR